MFKNKLNTYCKLITKLHCLVVPKLPWSYQSKTSHVTRRPSLKRLSGIQVQLLSLCMGKHKIPQNCSLSLRFNFIFEIGQQLCHKCCFFCSNIVIKSLFLKLDQSVCMRSLKLAPRSAECFYSNRESNGSCSDALTLPISDWFFHSEGGLSAIERSY